MIQEQIEQIVDDYANYSDITGTEDECICLRRGFRDGYELAIEMFIDSNHYKELVEKAWKYDELCK